MPQSVPFIGLNQTQWANKRLMATWVLIYARPGRKKEKESTVISMITEAPRMGTEKSKVQHTVVTQKVLALFFRWRAS